MEQIRNFDKEIITIKGEAYSFKEKNNVK